ncbi:hypothetical protein QEN19_000786 [Hanseniaspora menglaensis]
MSFSNVFNDIEPLLLVVPEKFNSARYLNKMLLNLANEKNIDYLDLNKSISSLKRYLNNEVILKKYNLIIKQFYNIFLKLSSFDNTRKDSINEAIIKNLNNLSNLVVNLENAEQNFLVNEQIIKVLFRAYNAKFLYHLYNVLSNLILSEITDKESGVSVELKNYEISNTVIDIIKDCNNILKYDPINYIETNVMHIKTEALKRLQIEIISNNYTKDIYIWQAIMKNSKKDFVLSVDRIMVALISSTNLKLNNFNTIVNSMIEKNTAVVKFEKFLIKDIKLYENKILENKSDEHESTEIVNIGQSISGLAYYKSVKFNENLKNRTLSFIYFGKVAKNLNAAASIQLSKTKKSELWTIIQNRFCENEHIITNKDMNIILKQFEIILNPDI